MKKNIPYPVIDLKKTGKNIRTLREERNLTVNDVMRYLNLDYPQAVYRWQEGKALPTVDHLLALSMLLEVRMEDILVSAPCPIQMCLHRSAEGMLLLSSR